MSRVTEVKDPAGNVTAYTYDALNRLTRKDIQTPAGVHAVTNYTYDAVGNLLSASNGESSVAFVYDALNRAVETKQSFAGKTYTISYAYDAVGNRTMMATPWGKYSYTYDVLNRVDAITNPQGIQINFKYDAAGRRIGKTVFAAARNTAPLAETAYSYDAAGQLLSITNKAGGKVAAFDNYTYDALGNRVRIEDQNGIKDYTYDKSSRLIVVKPVPFNMPSAEAFVYDRNGNRRYDRDAKDYKYDAANRLLENTVYTYTHDQLGNLTSRTEKASSATITYAYNPEQQLSNVITPDAKVEYKYDPLGRRIEKTVNANTARFLYDGQNIIADLGATGNPTNTYTNGPGIDEPLIMAKPDGKSYHYHADALGSITAITDNAGATIETYQYKAYGLPTIKNSTGAIIPASLIGNTRMFTAREYEPESGLYNNRRRSHDPDRGAFTQEDPIGFTGGVNLYAYVMNNPINYTDPMGEEVDINKFIRWIDANAQLESQHTCAKAIRQGLQAGGLDVSNRPERAKDYGVFLEKNGFKVISPDGYSPQKGDIVVFQTGPNPAGHIQVWNGATWVSDFIQNPNKISPYGGKTPSYTIYRQDSPGFWKNLVQNLKGLVH